MCSFFGKIWRAINQVQVLAVLLAFALMAFLGYFFMSQIVRDNLKNSIDNAILNTQSHIDIDFMEPVTSLNIVSETIKVMILRRFDANEVRDYIKDQNLFLQKNERFKNNTTGFYGYFDVFGGIMIPEVSPYLTELNPPHTRPWFKAALESEDEVSVSEPYTDLETGEKKIAFSRQIFDEDGNRLAIVCFNLKLERIADYSIKTSVTEDSYGFLVDKDFYILAHPHLAYIGKNISQLKDGEELIRKILEEGIISEYKIKDYNNQNSILFVRKLNNGWYYAILANEDNYYKGVKDLAVILCVIAFALASALSIILLNIVNAKKRAEERTQAMLDATPLCAELWDKDYKLIDCNIEAVKVYGFQTKKEYIDRFSEISPEYQPDGRLSKEKCFETLKKAFDEGYHRVEWLNRNIKGELIPSDVFLVRVKLRNDNIVCVYKRDLRDMKAVLTKMREADECTQILFDTSPLSCIMMDSSFNVIECNKEITRLFEIPDKQIFFDKVFSFSPEYQPSGEHSKEKLLKYINEAFEEGYCRFEWMHQKLSGEQIPTEVFFVRVKFRGMYAVAGYIRDLREIKAMIAEMKRAEIAEESSKAKSDFLAKMSHEIRTPMNAILGIAEIQLQDQSLSLTTREALDRIYNSGELLLGIINDILDLSKIEAGKLELIRRQYDIASLIHDIAKLNIVRYEKKQIEFKVRVEENVPKFLIGDELRIKQILNNLLSNAFKYTQEGIIELYLGVAPVVENTSIENSSVYIVIRVTDSGQGMTAEQIKQLGDKFSRFNLEANRKTEGTGLGMNITYNLIQLMNGNINVESTPGKGSIFTVKIPQICADIEPIGKEISENLMKLNLKTPTKLRNLQITQEYMPYGSVLIVDDVETNLYVARGLLTPYGLSIDTCLNGFDAIQKIKEGAIYDIIFMDHMMPKMDGIETVKIIREMGYSKPIVALTANALAGRAEMFFNNGFDDFISKPIDIRQLNSVLNKFIKDKQSKEIIEDARKQRNILYAQGANNIVIDPQLAEYFVRDAQKAVAILEKIVEKKLRRNDDLPVYIVNVHGMKSALANVGEKDLANDAMQLEKAGRENNIDLILSRLPDFISSLKKVIDKFEINDELSGSDELYEFADKSFLEEKLLIIQSACISMDKKTAKDAILSLKQKSWPRHIKDYLSRISEHLLHSEFEEAATITRDVFFK